MNLFANLKVFLESTPGYEKLTQEQKDILFALAVCAAANKIIDSVVLPILDERKLSK